MTPVTPGVKNFRGNDPVDFEENYGQMAGWNGVLATPRSMKLNPFVVNSGVTDLANAIYSIERDADDPVFFAVVPDSFMTRDTGRLPTVHKHGDWMNWIGEHERPLATPHDRWSF